MPRKPSKQILELAHKELDPKDVLTVIINEVPEIKKALFDAEVIKVYDKASGKYLLKSEGGKLE